MSGSFWRRLSWRLEALGFDLVTALVRAVPPERASNLGAWLACAIGPLTRADRIAERNIALAYPDWTPEARSALKRAQWGNFGRYLFEFPISDRLTPASGRVEVVGGEILRDLAASGRPAVLISGHFSNFEIMAAVIVDCGVVCDVTYRAANNPLVDQRIIEGRRAYGVTLFAPKGWDGAKDLMIALKAGRSIALLNDQKYDGGVEGRFFGHVVRTNPAAVRLALKFGAPIIPMSIARTGQAHFRCTVHSPLAIAETGDKTADIAAGVQTINDFIEARVREAPEAWWWMHRRWPAAASEATRTS